MKKPLFPEWTSSTFADYFKLNVLLEDILAHFDYSLRIESCSLPRKELDNGHLLETESRLRENLPYVNLINETARREFLIAPVLMEAIHYTRAKVSVEHPLEVSDQLKGNLDYFLRAANNVLVVEAKNADMQRGFTQLAVELVALDRWLADEPQEVVYGAVSVGDFWRFGLLDRHEKRVTQDVESYSVPTDLKELVQILAAILTG